MRLLILSATMLSWAASTDAQTLAQKQYYAAMQQQTDGALARVNDRCKSQIAASYDWSAFDDANRTKMTAASPCDDALTGISEVCAKPDGQRAVAQSIKKFVCHFGPPGHRTVTVKDGTVDWTTGMDQPSNDMFVYDYLQNHL